MGETRVDLLHLLEDLRDAYPGAIEETILTEVVANALDSGAAEIAPRDRPGRHHADRRRRRPGHAAPRAGPLPRHRGHDQDARPGHRLRRRRDQARPPGLGGGLDRDPPGRRSRRDAWGLTSRQRAPWRWIPPPGLVARRGTGVRLRLRNPLSPLLDPGYSRRRSAGTSSRSLIRPSTPSWPRTIRAESASRQRRPARAGRAARPESAPIAIRLARKRKPAAAGYLVRDRGPLPEEQRGLAISTFGKVIKRGWDWLGLTPAAPDRVGGLVEVPALAECLTLNKADFIRVGPAARSISPTGRRSRRQWPPSSRHGATSRTRATACGAAWPAPVERDLESVLGRARRGFPAARRRSWSAGRAASAGCPWDGRAGLGRERFCWRRSRPCTGSAAGRSREPVRGRARRRPPRDRDAPRAPAPASTEDGAPPTPAPTATLPSERGRRQPGRYGLSLQFDSASRRPGACPAGRVHRVDQRGPSGLPPRRGLAVRGLPHGGRRRARPRPARG